MEVTIQQLKKKQARLRIYYGAMVVYLGLAAAVLSKVLLPGIVLALLAPAAYFLFVYPAAKRFIWELKEYNLRFQYGKEFDSLELLQKNPFSLERIEAAGVIPTQQKGFLALNGLTGRYKDMEVLAGEFTNYHRTDLKNEKSSRLLFLTGTFVSIQLSLHTEENFRAVSVGMLAGETRDVFFEGRQGLKEVRDCEEDIDGQFLLYSGTGEKPDSGVRTALLRLRRASRDNVSAAVNGDRVDIVFQNGFLYPDYKAYSEVTAEAAQKCAFPELKAALEFADSIETIYK